LALVVVALTGCFFLTFCSGSSNPPASPETKSPAAEPAAPPSGPSSQAPSPTGQAAAPQQPVETQYAPEQATGAVKGIPAPTNTAPIMAVANYFTDLPGIDTASLKPRQKEKFLQRVNSELCTCGCRNDTLARCYVNDARCPVVKGMVQKVFEETKAGR